MKTSKLSLALITALALSGSVYADETSEIADLKKEMKELREITQTLVEETSDLKTGSNYTTVDTEKSHSGLGSAASKVYYSKSPLSIGGYGEAMYTNNHDGSTLSGTKFVPYIGYKFSDNIILNTEIEFEGGGVDRGGNAGDEVVVEFMYLDYLINKNANIRAGNFIIPMGLINQRHEPTLYNTVERPDTEKYLIPSTWTETGAMAYGRIVDNLTYNFATISALKTDVNGKEWLREGRGGPVERSNPNLGFAARLDYTGINGLLVGTSAYYGPSMDGVKSNTSIYDIHLDYKNNGARVYGVYSQATRSSASNIAANAVESAQGGYMNLSYDLLSLTSSIYSLPLFMQYESLNPEEKRADGTSGDSTHTTTMGINFFPHEQVVLKLNYAMKSQGTIDDKITSVSMGFIF
ncbi:MAG: porin [Campylobacterales bacterium]|nr:porin [Campylobacterales bacterium]